MYLYLSKYWLLPYFIIFLVLQFEIIIKVIVLVSSILGEWRIAQTTGLNQIDCDKQLAIE